MLRHLSFITLLLLALTASMPLGAVEYKRHITVAQDGSGDYTTLTEAMEGIRAFMDYTVTVDIKNGVYREKLVIPSWLRNVEFIGESRDSTVITFNDHANINKMGTFRTYTVKVEGCDLTFRNLTIENNAEQLGQAVALHTEGDRLAFINCRFLGNQDTIFTGGRNSRLYFADCYIEGTTDFIFGPATALFEDCTIYSKRDSYITAASTPQDVEVGYVFNRCLIKGAPGVKKVYLGRPWRPYAFTLFVDCEIDGHVTPAGWDNWRNPENEKTARYGEYGSTGAGAAAEGRVGWAMKPDADAARRYTDPAYIYKMTDNWNPNK